MKHELERVLFIDDEPDIRAVAQIALESVGGFTVRMCRDGDEALKVGQEFAPDMIVLDVMIPGKDGPTTLAEMRLLPTFADTPVVFLTAKAQAHEIEQYRRLGVADVISKPFDPMTLSNQLRDIWGTLHA